MNPQSCRKFRFLIPLAILAFLALFTVIVHALWNGVLAEVLGVKTVSYWQALGILVLAKILFGGFPGRCRACGPRGGWRGGMMAKRWESLTPEQREQLREEMRRRFGDWPHSPCCSDEPDESAGPGKPTTA